MNIKRKVEYVRCYEAPACDVISELEIDVLCESTGETSIESWTSDGDELNF